MRRFGIAYLTSSPLSALETIELAANTGYDDVGLRALPALPGGADHGLIGNPSLLRAVKARLKDTGIHAFDMEIVRILPDFSLEALHPFLEVCGEIGAKAVLVAGDDPDTARLTANFASFAEAAAPYGLTADLEFMPWTVVNDAKTAHRLVKAAGQPNGGVLVDALHFQRSSSTIEDIAAIPREMLHYAQICDASAHFPHTLAGLLHTARAERLAPGDGDIDIAALLKALPATIPIAVEAPNERAKADHGVEAWARRCLETSKTMLASADAA